MRQGMQEELQLLKRTSRCSRIKVAFEQRLKEVKGQVLWNLGGGPPRWREQLPTAPTLPSGTGTTVRLEQMGPGCGQEGVRSEWGWTTRGLGTTWESGCHSRWNEKCNTCDLKH